MADDDDITAEENPVPGPGVTAWLAGVIGTPRQSQANTPPPLPIGYGPERQARRVEIHLPEEVVVAEGGTLQRIEIRGLPVGVTLTAGSAMKDGFWQLDPADLYGIAALVPDEIDMPFSVMLKGVFIGDDPETRARKVSTFRKIAFRNSVFDEAVILFRVVIFFRVVEDDDKTVITLTPVKPGTNQ